jgi:hypothetical protein
LKASQASVKKEKENVQNLFIIKEIQIDALTSLQKNRKNFFQFFH